MANDKLITLAAIVGLVGDISLQMLTKPIGGKTGWGLNEYFDLHGCAESATIAAGMMSLFYAAYLYTEAPPTVLYLVSYGIILDLIFRKLRIFPSLDGYYSHLNYFWSAFWGAVPMITPYLIYIFLNDEKIRYY